MTPNRQHNNSKDEMIDLAKLFRYYLSFWKWILLAVIITTAIAFVYIKIKNPVYLITANLLIKSEGSQSPMASSELVKSFAGGFNLGSSNVDNEYYIISSHSLLRDVVKELGLQVRYVEKKFPLSKTHYNTASVALASDTLLLDTLKQGVSFKLRLEDNRGDVSLQYGKQKLGSYPIKELPATIVTPIGSFTFAATAYPPKGNQLKYDITLTPLEFMTKSLASLISISIVDKKSDVIGLSLETVLPEQGVDILNQIMYLYNLDAIRDKNAVAHNTAEFVESRLKLIATDLLNVEKEVEVYKKSNQLTDLETEIKIVLEKNGDFKDKLIEAGTQLNIIEMVESYLTQPENRYAMVPASLGINEKGTLSAISDYNKLLLDRSKLLRNTNPSNPMILLADEQIELTRANVLQSISSTKSGYKVVLKDLKEQERLFMSRVAEMPTQEREFLDIKRQQVIKESLFLFLLQKREETALLLASTEAKAKIIDKAFADPIPVAPKKMIVLGGGFAGGFVLSLLTIYLISLFDNKIHSKKDLKEMTDIPVLGQVFKSEKKEPIVVADGSFTAIAELFRLIRSNLSFYLQRDDQKVILVTSTISGEGKSFIASNLATSLSLLGKRVVVVGLDIRNPQLAEIFPVDRNHKGVTHFLASQRLTVDEVILPSTLNPYLDVVISGSIPPNPSELLMSNRLDSFFAELKRRYDYIVVDTAPVGMVSDTYSLNRIADATLYVCRADYSHKNHIHYAEEIVSSNKLKNLSLVINATDVKKAHDYGSGVYGYGYGSDNFGNTVNSARK